MHSPESTAAALADARALWQDTELPTSERVDALLGVMTVPEKVAQLGSYWPRGQVDRSDEDRSSAQESQVAPMDWVIRANDKTFEQSAEHGLGHITRGFGSEPVRPSVGIKHLRDMQEYLHRQTRLGLPAIAHEECLTGVTTLGATVYPAAIAWGASFDPGLIERMATAIGRDMADLGVHQGLSPLLDVVRDYRWGRVEETCGEDPYLVGSLGTAYVQGLQSQGIIATLKHFAGYSASQAGRNHAPVSMGPREFADVMLPSF